MKVQLEMERRRQWKKKKLHCRELHTVEAGFMVGGKDTTVRLIPSLSNCGTVQDFPDTDSKGFVQREAVIRTVFRYG